MWTQGGRSQHRGYRITQSLHCVAKSNSFAECVLLNNPPGEPPHLASAATRPRDHPLNLSGVPWSTLMAGEPSDAPDGLFKSTHCARLLDLATQCSDCVIL